MSQTNYSRLVFSLVISIIIAGCAGPKFALDTTRVSVKDILKSIENEQNKLVSFESTSRISVDSPEFSGTFFAQIFYLEPDSLLISATGPFGIHAGTLFIGRERFIFHNQINNRFYNGSVAKYKDRNFFQFPLKLSEFMYAFSGKEHLSALKIIEYNIDDDKFFIRAEKADVIYRIWVDNVSGRISKLIATNGDQTLYIKEYGDFININGMFFPRKISITRPEQSQALSVYHTRISLNSKIEKSRFQIQISDRAEQIDYSNYNGN